LCQTFFLTRAYSSIKQFHLFESGRCTNFLPDTGYLLLYKYALMKMIAVLLFKCILFVIVSLFS